MKTVMLVLLMIDLFTWWVIGDPFSLVVPDGLISAKIGSSVVLSCRVATALDIKSYEVRWYRPNKKDNPILLYNDLKVQENAGDPQYRGRVSLIGELEKRDVSLKLENLTLADRGEYKCFVKSPSWYEAVGVSLNITVVGSPPLLSLAEAGEQMNVTCTSDGWSPKPTLTWRDKGGRGLRRSVDHSTTDSEGLVSVSSWLLFSPSESEWISCSVGLSDQERKEGRVLPVKPATVVSEPGVSRGWKAFIISLVISLLVFTLMALLIISKIRGLIFPKAQKSVPEGNLEEQTPLENSNPPSSPHFAPKETGTFPKSVPEKKNKGTNTEKEIPDWEQMLACKVAIRPDASSTSFLEIGKSQSRVTCTSDVRDKTGFIHALCEERISSGRYYWEITALTEPHTSKHGKSYKCPSSWYVGVTSETEKKSKVALTPQNGYWVLHYEREKGYYVNDPSQTPVLVRDRFSKLGVFLDCEKHKLSFYDCDKHSHLYTFYHVHSTPLIPVLSPGDKKEHTIIICQEKCVQCDEHYEDHKVTEQSRSNSKDKNKQTGKTQMVKNIFKPARAIRKPVTCPDEPASQPIPTASNTPSAV